MKKQDVNSRSFSKLSHTIALYRKKDYIRLGVFSVQNFPFSAEIIAENLYVPWAVDLSGDGRLYFTERNGRLRLIENGVLNPEPVYTFEAPFVNRGEG